MELRKLIKKINKENTPPGGWRPKDKAASSRRGGPSHKESGCKPSSVFPKGKINWFKKKMDRDQA